jgi:hypothetical protein
MISVTAEAYSKKIFEMRTHLKDALQMRLEARKLMGMVVDSHCRQLIREILPTVIDEAMSMLFEKYQQDEDILALSILHEVSATLYEGKPLQ